MARLTLTREEFMDHLRRGYRLSYNGVTYLYDTTLDLTPYGRRSMDIVPGFCCMERGSTVVQPIMNYWNIFDYTSRPAFTILRTSTIYRRSV